MHRSLVLTAAIVAGTFSALTSHAGTGTVPPATAVDGILVAPSGMTLYTFDNDPVGAGKSACNGPCAQKWPPLKTADSDRPTSEFTVISRDDGSKQWAYKGKPLYFWSNDSKTGDTTGDGVKGVWHTAKP